MRPNFPPLAEPFFAHVGALDWLDIQGRFGTIDRLFETETPIISSDRTALLPGLLAHLSPAHVAALGAIALDLADPVALAALPPDCPPDLRAHRASQGLVSLHGAALALGSVFAGGRIGGRIWREIERAFRFPWDPARAWLGHDQRDVLRLGDVIGGPGAPLDEQFFFDFIDDLPDRLFSDGTPFEAAAIIADARADRSLLTSQFHVAVLAFQNRQVDQIRALPRPPSDADTIRDKATARTRDAALVAFLDTLSAVCAIGTVEKTRDDGARYWPDRQTRIGAPFAPIEAIAVLEAVLHQTRPGLLAPNLAIFRSGQSLSQSQYHASGLSLPRKLLVTPRLPRHLDPALQIDWHFLLRSEIGDQAGDTGAPPPGHLMASGQQAALQADLPVLTPAEVAGAFGRPVPDASPLVDYVLAESLLLGKFGRLGPLGSLILADTCVGLAEHWMTPDRTHQDMTLAAFLGAEIP